MGAKATSPLGVASGSKYNDKSIPLMLRQSKYVKKQPQIKTQFEARDLKLEKSLKQLRSPKPKKDVTLPSTKNKSPISYQKL